MDMDLLKLIREIVFAHIDSKRYHVFIFGSRAKGAAAKFSDIDVGVEGDSQVSTLVFTELEEAFENSDLPFTVDVVDFTLVSDKFKQIAKQHLISLN